MEAEIVSLSHSCREVFPICDMTQAFGNAVGLPIGETTIKVSIHEDNASVLVLAQTLPPQFTPWSKHYAAKTIWFCEEITKRKIKLLKMIGHASNRTRPLNCIVIRKIKYRILIKFFNHFSSPVSSRCFYMLPKGICISKRVRFGNRR